MWRDCWVDPESMSVNFPALRWTSWRAGAISTLKVIMSEQAIDRVVAALDEVRAGKMVIVVDDEHRENEGDLCMAAELVTPQTINFMAKYARGLICLSLTEERVEALDLPMMVGQNRSTRGTAFTVSIEAREGVTTGISAADRARTVLTAVADDTRAADISSPGHIFPLKARQGGVLQRTGHTEGSVDLARLAGLKPAGVICEIMKDDGTMARYPDLVDFAKEHDLKIISIADIIQYRLRTEGLVHCVKQGELTLPSGVEWSVSVYEVRGDGRQFMALKLGEVSDEPTLVRVHTGSVAGDVFGATRHPRVRISDAVSRIEAEGNGVILFLPGRVDLERDLGFYLGEETPPPSAPQDEGEVLREYGLGAQVLRDLGLSKIRVLTNRPRRIPSLEAYGLSVVDQLLLNTEAVASAGQGDNHTVTH